MRKIGTTITHRLEERAARTSSWFLKAGIRRPVQLFFSAVSHIDDVFAVACRGIVPKEAVVSGPEIPGPKTAVSALLFKAKEMGGGSEAVDKEALALRNEFFGSRDSGSMMFFHRLVSMKKAKLLVSVLSRKEIQGLFTSFYFKKDNKGVASLVLACNVSQRAELLSDLYPRDLAFLFLVLKEYSFSYLLKDVLLEEQDLPKVREALKEIKADSKDDHLIVRNALSGFWKI